MLVVLIVLGIITYITYKLFIGDKILTPKSRKVLNFVLDTMTIAFHAVFLSYVKGFVYESNKTDLLVAFWLILIALCLFILRCLLKWYYFCFGAGKNNDGLWLKPFKFDEAMMKRHLKMLDEIKNDVNNVYKMRGDVNKLLIKIGEIGLDEV